MIDHTERLKGVVKAALKANALGRPVGFTLTQGYVAVMGNEGPGIGVGWLLGVTVRNPLLGKPDIGVTLPLSGVLPPDEAFVQAAGMLLDKCQEIADNNAKPLAGDVPQFRPMPEGPTSKLPQS